MDSNILSLNDPVTFSEVVESSENLQEIELDASDQELDGGLKEETDVVSPVVEIEFPEDLLTNEVYLNGLDSVVSAIDPDSVRDEVYYVDYGQVYNNRLDLPDYAVVFDCNGNEVVFPTDYADQVFVVDGLLVNLGSNYTAGLLVDGYSVNNYLSSEVTIPTYHSSTWYQYMQSYGQPYRIVDRYVNNYGSISSSTRESVSLEWSGGNPWAGFTFDRASMFIVIAVLLIMLVFRKGRR